MSTARKSSTGDAESPAGRRGGLSRDAIREVALIRFAHQGYHATSLREIASDLNVTVAALYYHYPNKDELLTEVVEQSIQADFQAAALIRDRGEGPLLDAMLRMHVLRHIDFRDEALVVHHESKYLPEPYSDRVRAILREYEAAFRDVIVVECDIPSDRLTVVTKVVLGMGAAVIHWFQPHALLSADEVADRYVLYMRSVLAVEERSADDSP